MTVIAVMMTVMVVVMVVVEADVAEGVGRLKHRVLMALLRNGCPLHMGSGSVAVSRRPLQPLLKRQGKKRATQTRKRTPMMVTALDETRPL